VARIPWRWTVMREPLEKKRRYRPSRMRATVAAENPAGLIPLTAVILVTFISGLIIGAFMAMVLVPFLAIVLMG